MKRGNLGKKVAQFRQINVGRPMVHHDALEFPDGETVLLTRMCEGQHATVLQLPASGRPVNAAEGQKRDSSGSSITHGSCKPIVPRSRLVGHSWVI
jgi:hypothetical protein